VAPVGLLPLDAPSGPTLTGEALDSATEFCGLRPHLKDPQDMFDTAVNGGNFGFEQSRQAVVATQWLFFGL
jgi:hypothetical protein